jgi:hypothetical protein
MNSESLAVLIIGYSRCESLLNLIKTVIVNNPSALYIALDGAKDDFVKLVQIEILDEIKKIRETTLIPIQVQQRTENLGSGAGVISAVNWFFENESQGIVLEDDLVVDQNFFVYMSKVISILKTQPAVLLASGTRLNMDASEYVTFCSYPLVWGWATTRDKWQLMTDAIFSETALKGVQGRLSEKIFWNTGKKRALKSQIDAWDIPLASGMRSMGYVSLVPPVNLVTNIGFDANASHTSELRWPLNLDRAVSLPSAILLDQSKLAKAENDKLMRNKIFQIGFMNIFTGAAAIFWDSIRFRNRSGIPPLKERSGHGGYKG